MSKEEKTNEEIGVKKILMISAITLVSLVVLISARNMMFNGGIPITGNIVRVSAAQTTSFADADLKPNGEMLDVAVSINRLEYIMEPSTFTKGQTVRMTFDMNTVRGCMRDVVIPAFNIREQISEGNNVIEFIPTKAGEFDIACSMNMGYGTFTVQDTDGSVPKTTRTTRKAAPTSTCDGSCGGGCDGDCDGSGSSRSGSCGQN